MNPPVDPPLIHNSRFARREPESKIIHEDHIPSIVPPAVVAPRKGSWDHYAEEVRDDGLSIMVLKGRQVRKDLDYSYKYWDRKKLRILHMDSKLTIPPGLTTDIEIFGPQALIPVLFKH
jgi:hypothetical protein